MSDEVARVVNDFTHGSMVDAGSFDYAGQCMFGSACRPTQTHRAKVVKAEAAVKRKQSEANASALAVLHRELYHCEFGCTTPPSVVAKVQEVPTQRARTHRVHG